MNREELVLVVCRKNIEAETLQPLQLVIPTMQVAGPFSLYTSMRNQIKEIKDKDQNQVRNENKGHIDLYQALRRALLEHGEGSLSQTLKKILDLRKNKQKKFRVCILGGINVNWDIVLEYKRHNIIIDTAGREDILSQVSHTTGGISKRVNAGNLIKTFLTDFSMASETRKYFFLQKDSRVQFHMQPYCCPNKKLTSNFFVCSVCMAIYCDECRDSVRICPKCDHKFDPDLPPLEPELEIALFDEKERKRQAEERVDIG